MRFKRTYRWVWIRQLSNLGQPPEDRVSRKRPVTIFLRDTNCSKTLLMDPEITGTCVQKIEDYHHPKLARYACKAMGCKKLT